MIEQKFEPGDKVSVEGEIGYVRDYFCDEGHHMVEVDFGHRVTIYHEGWVVYEGEDRYEYAVRLTKKGTDEPIPDRLVWMTKAEAQADINLLGGSSKFYNYNLVKRLKAGPIEEV
jgi:hypothetical protein